MPCATPLAEKRLRRRDSSTTSCVPGRGAEGTAARPPCAILEHDIDLDGWI